MAKRVTLYYGGQTFQLAEGEDGILTRFQVNSPYQIEVALQNGGRVKLLAGPGIHAALTVEEEGRGFVR